MRKLLAVLLLVLPLNLMAQMEALVMPQEDGSVLILLPTEAVKACGEQGGCRIVTTRDLEAALAAARATCTGI